MGSRNGRHGRGGGPRGRPLVSLRLRNQTWSLREAITVAAILAVLGGVLVYCAFVLHRRADAFAVTAELLTQPGDVRIGVADLDVGRARFFRYQAVAGREVRFFVLKGSDGVTRAAFDGCERCYRQHQGYRQAGPTMICSACGRSLPAAEIGVAHSECYPIPVPAQAQGDDLVITAASLASGVKIF